MSLRERVALVTGAAQGIGLAIAELFVAAGAVVVLVDLDGEAATSASRRLGSGTEALACDVVDEEAVRSTVEGIAARHGRLDILVNNAGITRDAMMHRMSLADFRDVYRHTPPGKLALFAGSADPYAIARWGRRDCHLSSISGKVANLGQSNYAAAKAASSS